VEQFYPFFGTGCDVWLFWKTRVGGGAGEIDVTRSRMRGGDVVVEGLRSIFAGSILAD